MLYPKKGLLFLLFLLLGASLCGQNPEQEQLEKALSAAVEDTLKIKLSNELCELHSRQGNFDKAIEYGSAAFTLSEKISSLKWKAKSLTNLGIVQEGKGNYTQALAYYFDALKARNQLNDPIGIAACYNNIGLAYYYLGNYPESIKNHFAALRLKEKIGDKKSLAASYNNIGIVYWSQKNYDEALAYLQKGLTLRTEIQNKLGIATSYGNIAMVYEDKNNIEEAMKNYAAALSIRKEIDDESGMAPIYNNLGSLFEKRKDYKQSLENHLKALSIYEKNGEKVGIVSCYINISNSYLKTKDLKNAKAYLDKGLKMATEMGYLEALKSSYSVMELIDSTEGNFKLAYEHYKMFVNYRDSLINETNTKKTIQSQLQFEFDKKEAATAAEQEKRDALNAEEKQRQKVILYAISTGLLLVLLFAIFIYRSFKQKQKANIEITKQKEIVELKQKEILDSIHYAKRIQGSLLPTNSYIDRTLKRLKNNK